ncbi:hypothetical protein KDK88_00905 [bacterium]|nr:hypothetical protein [bacterium]
MNSACVKKSAESIVSRVWERGGSREGALKAVRDAFATESDGDACAAVRHAVAWLDAAEAVPGYDPAPAHTPLPWSVECGSVYRLGFGPFDNRAVRVAAMVRDTYETGPTERDANARLIVLAVNHHAALVSALLALVHPAAGDDDVDAARALLMDLGALAEGAPSPGEVQP